MCYVACVTDEDVARRYELVRPHLDEKARRLVLGAEAVALGRGGTKRVAEATGAHPDTVARGRREVQSAEPQDGRNPPAGGGTPAAGRDRSGSASGIGGAGGAGHPGRSDVAVEVDDQVDPEPGRGAGRAGTSGVAPDRGQLLTASWGTACRPTPRPSRAAQHPDRDAQFGYLNAQAERAHGRGQPGDQRGHQEEGTGRRVQERWPGMAARGEPRAGRRSTTSPTRTGQGRSRTASTTWPPTPAGSSWAPTTTPPPSR